MNTHLSWSEIRQRATRCKGYEIIWSVIDVARALKLVFEKHVFEHLTSRPQAGSVSAAVNQAGVVLQLDRSSKLKFGQSLTWLKR